MKINKNTEFSIRFIILISLIIFLLFDFFVLLYSPKQNLTGITYYERLNISFSFFTVQTNYMVVIYLFYALFLRHMYNKVPPFGIQLAITVYISITMLLFWAGIAVSNEDLGYNAINWLTTTILHLIIPIIMINEFFLSMGGSYYNMRYHAKFTATGIALYPISYLIVILIRGELRFRELGPEFFNSVYSFDSINNVWTQRWSEVTGGGFGIIDSVYMRPFDWQMWHPYWFFNLRNFELSAYDQFGELHIWYAVDRPQWMTISIFVTAVVFMLGVVYALQFVFIILNNKQFYRWHSINGISLSKDEHKNRLKVIKIQKLEKKAEIKKYKIHLKTLPRTERKEFKIQSLKNSPYNFNEKEAKKQFRKDAKILLASAKTADRNFILENLHETYRLQKLIRKNVLVYDVEYRQKK